MAEKTTTLAAVRKSMQSHAGDSLDRWIDLIRAAALEAVARAGNDDEIERIENLLEEIESAKDDRQDEIDDLM